MIACTSRKEVQGQIRAAVDWSADPWLTADTTDHTNRYAAMAYKQRPDAWSTFTRIWDYVEYLKSTFAGYHAAEQPLETEKKVAEQELEGDSWSGDHAISPLNEEPFAKRLKPSAKSVFVPPPPPPAKRKSSSPSPYAAHMHAAGQQRSSLAASSSQEPLPWQTTQFDVRNWIAVLDENHVGKVSQQELLMLSQHSQEGAVEANRIISKVLKKMSDGVQLRNPSASVHTSVQAARNTLH